MQSPMERLVSHEGGTWQAICNWARHKTTSRYATTTQAERATGMNARGMNARNACDRCGGRWPLLVCWRSWAGPLTRTMGEPGVRSAAPGAARAGRCGTGTTPSAADRWDRGSRAQVCAHLCVHRRVRLGDASLPVVVPGRDGRGARRTREPASGRVAPSGARRGTASRAAAPPGAGRKGPLGWGRPLPPQRRREAPPSAGWRPSPPSMSHRPHA